MKFLTSNTIYITVFIFFCTFHSFSQKDWISTIQTPKEFIENKGQFDDQIKSSDKILFATNLNGMKLYFTSSGITYRIDEVKNKELDEFSEKKSNENKHLSSLEKEREREREREIKMRSQKIKSHLAVMKWLNSNPNVQIVKEQEVLNYYTYNNPKDPSGKTGLKAKAYQKIIYKNLYPNIDVEYFFPEGKEGFKYNIIVHPGGDYHAIAMKYNSSSNLKLDEEGNVQFDLHESSIIEHSPFTYDENDHQINSKFKISNNILQFELSNYDPSKTITIDPWVTNSNFPVINRAYDIDFDNLGNVYIYGGGDYQHGSPFTLKKFNESGVLLWSFTDLTLGYINYYTDFAIDHNTGTAYVVVNLMSYAKIAKVDNTGTVTSTFSLEEISTEPLEIWRIVYNPCSNKLIAGLGNAVSLELHNILEIDSDFSDPTLHSILSFGTDIGSLSLSKDGANIFYMNNINSYTGINQNCFITKQAVTNLNATLFSSNTNYNFNECLSVDYYQTIMAESLSFNGICSTKDFVYTYDSYTIKKWNIISGALISTHQISTPVQWDPVGFGMINKIMWGGIDADDCGNIYVGYQNSIQKYDENLTLLSTIPVADTIYDCRIGDQEKLYACGNGYVSQIELSPITIVTNYTNPSNCGVCDGFAFVSGLCPSSTDDYTYSWNTTPVQVNDTAYNLCAGTYIVTVTTNNCTPTVIYTDTITLSGGNGPALLNTLSSTIASCTSNNGSATVSTSGGIPPYSYEWNTTPVQTTPTIVDLPSGMYTVTVSDSGGCSKTDSIMVESQNTMELTLTSQAISCTTNLGSASVTVVNGNPLFEYLWSNGDETTSTNVSSPGYISVSVTDAIGCVSVDSVFVDSLEVPTTIASSNSPICEGDTLYLFASNSNVAGSVYNWSGPTGYSSNLQNPNRPNMTISDGGPYIVTVSLNGCSSTDTVIVNVLPIPIPGFTADKTIGCEPLTVLFTDNSTPASTSVIWDFGDGTTSTSVGSVIHTFLNSGTYDITLTATSNGCSNSLTKDDYIQVNPFAIASFSANPTTALTDHPYISFVNSSMEASSFLWDFGDGTSSTSLNPDHTYPEIAGEYDVILIANNYNNCPDTTSITITINESLIFYVPNTFTPDDDKFNQFFEPVFTSGFDPNSYSLQIFNRWGEIVFETKSTNTGWDGRYKGMKVPDGTYSWTIVFKDKLNDKKYRYNGHVNVLR